MHDNMTVAFEVRSPFKRNGYRRSLVTIWHVDPERDGTDDSCDWFGRKRPLSTKERALWRAVWQIENVLDNSPHYPDSPEHQWYQTLKDATRDWRHRERHWWQHPRWHIHHWRVQVHLWGTFHRWAFVRCSKCGGRFRWNEGVVGSWDGKHIWHFDCDRLDKAVIETREADPV